MRRLIFSIMFLLIIQLAIPLQYSSYSVYAAMEGDITGDPETINSTSLRLNVSTEDISASVLSVPVPRTSEALQKSITDDTMQWTKINDPQLSHLEGLCYGKGIYVAVGWGGTIQTSADGITWDKSVYPGINRLNAVIFADNRFVILGEKGSILVSTDGKNWSKKPVDTQASLDFAAWNGKIIVAAGTNGTFIVSSDFQKWDLVSLNDTAVHINSIIWDGKSFIACGPRQSIGSYSSNTVIMKSSDGYKWETCSTIGILTPFSIAYNGQKYVAVCDYGKILVSRNLRDWSESSIKSMQPLYSIIWTGERFVACGNHGELQYSIDGSNWRRVAMPVDTKLFAAAYNEGRTVIVGENGVILSSDNMTGWEIRQSYSYDYIHKIIWDGKRLIAINNSYIYTSEDGNLWQKYILDVGSNRRIDINDIIWNGNEYAISGLMIDYNADSEGPPWTGTVLISQDLEKWKCSVLPGSAGLRGIAWGLDSYVAVGDLGKIYVSPNGLDWKAVRTGLTKGLTNIVWNGSSFVAVGSGGTILVSENITEWQKAAYDQDDYLSFLKCENRKLFMLGSNSEDLYTSDDGLSWKHIIIPNGYQIRDIVHYKDKYIAVCSLGIIGISSDAEDWSFEQSSEPTALDCIIQNGSGLTIIGIRGLLLQGKQ